ncbi:UDP-N-acetylmuramate dehydrogenase [Nonlabens xiamenensis]|uniref:UDP-N-acetylmuramate dehydrogenase n=1 Tax=Nonlabens xiamenensis TaxID=2341043 RepID=UPI000F604BF4|nr:UDP-N-acetylmuramate dehydrogenase [Nonlabens xiamenensis]
MIEIHHNYNLKELNTFGISAFAKAYTAPSSRQQLMETLGYYVAEDIFLMGGGSNMLLLDDIQKPVVHVCLKGIERVEEKDGKVLLKVMAGENWHELVMYCIDQQLAGIENLALIPGNAGTAPIQNIGAYGVELKDVFHSCEVIDLKSLECKKLSLEDCKFGYRDSIFKNEAKGRYVISSVQLELTDLTQVENYTMKTDYGAIKQELDIMDGELTISSLAQAVINIRSSKLPDPKVIGNSGSFFKNPIIKKEKYEDILRMHPQLPSYPVDEMHVKVPAGWLIDRSGFKGKRNGDAGVHDKQALVLVNHGKATGKEILELSKQIQQAVKDRYGIQIETEVNLINE